MSVRTRFAPSPTGPLHIGGLRTALFAYCFARRHGGKFILRIEDTDQQRLVPASEAYIQEALDWIGITPDEGPAQGGPYGPYRQSERKHIYQEYVKHLLQEGKAYYAFDTPEELDDMRARLQAAKVIPQYDARSRTSMKNALTLPEEEVQQRLAAGDPYVVRLRVTPHQPIRFEDTIRGWVRVDSSTVDDKVLLKADGMPTYHLANVVDDHLMGITHVIRGEEWLPSTPLHYLLYEAFGWQPPSFAHLPLLLKPEGKGKLSKRDGDQHGFPVFPLAWQAEGTEATMGFREAGYLAPALLNFLALLGWSPGNDQEIFSLQELCTTFSLERVGKAGVKFDLPKLQWLNQHYLRQLSPHALMAYLPTATQQAFTPQRLEQAIALVQERLVTTCDLDREIQPLLTLPAAYDHAALQAKWKPTYQHIMKTLIQQVQYLSSPFTAAEIRAAVLEVVQANDMKPGQLFPLIRIALLGSTQGPDLFSIMEFLGQAETLQRLHTLLSTVGD